MFLSGGSEDFLPQASSGMLKSTYFYYEGHHSGCPFFLAGSHTADKIELIVQDKAAEESKITNSNPDFAAPGLTTTPLGPHHHYSAEELSMAVATSCVCALVVGFITGFLMARRCSCSSRDDDNPYHVPYLHQLVFSFELSKLSSPVYFL